LLIIDFDRLYWHFHAYRIPMGLRNWGGFVCIRDMFDVVVSMVEHSISLMMRVSIFICQGRFDCSIFLKLKVNIHDPNRR
jgi:hypothetical protein